jgi:hypothetical protein
LPAVAGKSLRKRRRRNPEVAAETIRMAARFAKPARSLLLLVQFARQLLMLRLLF